MRFIQAQRVAKRWNDRHGVGTPVIYESIKGDQSTRRQTKTTAAAFVADSGIAVIFVEGVRGYVALSHVIEVTGRTTTLEEYMAEATRRFGPDKMKWKFVCPCCRHVASAEDYKSAGAPESAVGFSCIGRWLGPKRGAFEDGEGPCDYAGGGLIGMNPVEIQGQKDRYFEFAEAIDATTQT